MKRRTNFLSYIAQVRFSPKAVLDISNKICLTEKVVKEEEEYHRILDRKLEEEALRSENKPLSEDYEQDGCENGIIHKIDETCKRLVCTLSCKSTHIVYSHHKSRSQMY